MINDDTTSVGEVHAGLAYCLDWNVPLGAAAAEPAIREVSKLRGSFRHLADLAELWHTPEQFESWSRFLIEAGVLGDMGATPPGHATRAGAESGLDSLDSAEP
jgi:predicted NUDIX family phosphoesterase